MSSLTVLFTSAGLLQLGFWVLAWVFVRRIGAALDGDRLESQVGTPAGSAPRVSVVVAVRDGFHTLTALLDALNRQTHRPDETVIVDDHSSDGTPELLRQWSVRDSRIRPVINRGRGKKAAVRTGVETARNDLLALTDADCAPEPSWIAGIVAEHTDGEHIVTGYGPYRPEPGLLNRLVRYETVHAALLSMSSIATGRPYMAVGRNLSYRKSTFGRLAGDVAGSDLLSGDDDLFIQAAGAAGIPARFMTDPATFVYSDAPATLRQWIRQKRRHLSAGRNYDWRSRLGLAAYHGSAILCWIAPLLVGWAGLAVLLCRLVPGQLVMGQVTKRLQEPNLAAGFIGLDALLHLYLVVLAPLAWVRPPREW